MCLDNLERGWESTISSPKFGTSIVNTAYGAYLDHAYAQNLAKPPFMRICREFENWLDLRTLSGKFCNKNLAIRKVFAFCDSGHDIPLRIISLNVPWNLHLSRNDFFSNISWRRCRSQNLINLLFCTELSREFPMPLPKAHRIFF